LPVIATDTAMPRDIENDLELTNALSRLNVAPHAPPDGSDGETDDQRDGHQRLDDAEIQGVSGYEKRSDRCRRYR
jgi:hypothetical protein